MQSIPFSQFPQWRQQISLNEEIFILTFKWNALNEYWSMNIYDSDFNLITAGIKIVNQFNLTEQIVQDGMPQGEILCQSIINSFAKIGRYDMDETSQLIFYPPEELEI